MLNIPNAKYIALSAPTLLKNAWWNIGFKVQSRVVYMYKVTIDATPYNSNLNVRYISDHPNYSRMLSHGCTCMIYSRWFR